MAEHFPRPLFLPRKWVYLLGDFTGSAVGLLSLWVSVYLHTQSEAHPEQEHLSTGVKRGALVGCTVQLTVGGHQRQNTHPPFPEFSASPGMCEWHFCRAIDFWNDCIWAFVIALIRTQVSFLLTFECSVVISGMCREVTGELNMGFVCLWTLP